MNRTRIVRKLREESQRSITEVIADRLMERLAERGETLGGLARKIGMENRTMRRSIFEREGGMSLAVLARICSGLDLEIQLVPKGKEQK